MPEPRINPHPLLVVLLQPLEQLIKWHNHPLDEFTILKRLFRLRISLLQLYLHSRELHIRRAHTRIAHNRWTDIRQLALVSRLLVQLADAGVARRFGRVDKACGKLDTDGIDGRSVLQDDDSGGRLGRVPDNGADGDSVDAGLTACLARGGFPYARFARLVGPGYLLELDPFRFVGGERVDGGNFSGLRHVVGSVMGMCRREEAGEAERSPSKNAPGKRGDGG